MFRIAAIIAIIFFCSCSKNIKDEDALLIIHTNDHHGAIFQSNGLGGLSQRAEFIKTLRKQHENVLILDAGDINTGGALSNIFKAEPDILAYNFIGYDAVVLGNHEFDKPPEILQKQMANAAFKFLSANIKTSDGKYLANPYIIKKAGNIRIAIIGITTSDTPQTSLFGKQFVFENEIDSAREIVNKVHETEKPDLVILLTHVGIGLSSVIADSVAGIDLIVDGHSHTRMDAPLLANGVPIVSAFEQGKEVGQAKFIFEDGKIKNFDWKSTKIDSSFPESREINEIIKPFADSLQSSMKDSIAESCEEFVFFDEAGNRLPRMGESAIGSLVCDAVMFFIENSKYKADFALINGGSIRAGLPKGKITRENVFEVLPFENFVDIVELSGSQLAELFDFIATIPQGDGGFAQFSKEIRYESNVVAINGEEIDPKKKYFVATNDYLSSGGDKYIILTQSLSNFKTSKLLYDIVIEYLQNFEQTD